MTERLPLPPRDANVEQTVCQYCTVGCGYTAYTWPVGGEGSLTDNALGDFSRPQPSRSGIPYTASMHNVVLRDGVPHHLVLIPANDSPINVGRNHSSRGVTNAASMYASDRPTRDRLQWPLLRVGSDLVPITWEEAVEIAGGVLAGVLEKHGSEGICAKAFDHGGGGGGFENNWAVGKLLFEGFQTQNVAIHNRPAYNSEVWGSRDRGVHELHYTAEDGHLCDTLVIWGANPYETATVFYLEHLLPNFRGETREEKRAAFPDEPESEVRWVVIDPRRSASLEVARSIAPDRVLHLRPAPGTDVVLADAIARAIHAKKWSDREFIANRTDAASWEAYQKGSLRTGVPYATAQAEASRITGVPVSDIEKAAEWMARPKKKNVRRRTLTLYEKGIIWNYRNYDTVAAVVQVSAIGGNLGRPGTGCGRQGGHQEGYVRPGYPGGRPPVNVDQLLIDGGGKAYWVMGTNPYRSTPRTSEFRSVIGRRTASLTTAIEGKGPVGTRARIDAILEGLAKGDGLFLIVSELYLTETTRDAHLVLPAAGWGEAQLTSINCNSRLLRLYDRFMDPPGEAKPDWWICQEVAKATRAALGAAPQAKQFTGWTFETAEDVFLAGGASFPDNVVSEEEAEGLPCECYRGVTYALLKERGQEGIATPVRQTDAGVVGTKRRYTHRFGSADGKLSWHAADPWAGYPAELERDVTGDGAKEHAFWLTTGRNVHLWQTGYHDRHLPTKTEQVPLPYVEIHPDDAKRLGIGDLELVEVYNRTGMVVLQARITEAVAPGQLFGLQYHWAGTSNALITRYTDPKTTIPWYKGARVGVRRVGPVSAGLQTSPRSPIDFGV
ncbi:MAG: arsenate reductase (azurin) large subunit [Myxococcota bacterium]